MAQEMKGYVERESKVISDWSAVNTDESDYGGLRKSIGNARK